MQTLNFWRHSASCHVSFYSADFSASRNGDHRLNMFESSDSFHLTYFTFGTVESVDENLDVGSSQTWTAQAICQAPSSIGSSGEDRLGSGCAPWAPWAPSAFSVESISLSFCTISSGSHKNVAGSVARGERRRLAPKIKFLHFLHARSELISLRQDEARLGMHLPKHHETG